MSICTVPEIKKFLNLNGVKFPPDAKKDQLIKILKENSLRCVKEQKVKKNHKNTYRHIC